MICLKVKIPIKSLSDFSVMTETSISIYHWNISLVRWFWIWTTAYILFNVYSFFSQYKLRMHLRNLLSHQKLIIFSYWNQTTHLQRRSIDRILWGNYRPFMGTVTPWQLVSITNGTKYSRMGRFRLVEDSL